MAQITFIKFFVAQSTTLKSGANYTLIFFWGCCFSAQITYVHIFTYNRVSVIQNMKTNIHNYATKPCK